jgi:hypothetical protein
MSSKNSRNKSSYRKSRKSHTYTNKIVDSNSDEIKFDKSKPPSLRQLQSLIQKEIEKEEEQLAYQKSLSKELSLNRQPSRDNSLAQRRGFEI